MAGISQTGHVEHLPDKHCVIIVDRRFIWDVRFLIVRACRYGGDVMSVRTFEGKVKG